ncbi:hypothetical protein LA080_012182 [Diaporthe eres]|uniref:Major facilitator superfamily (MFS) profile domain-containing protein n=1 Tax=Diaporthe vaccinii TaxID=105482 RepID=A0ABR4F5B7_9PEZI|nr:hypothetical protein LA080_012182 [Diaporthe eres]
MLDGIKAEQSSRISRLRLPDPMRQADVHPDVGHITDRHEREIAILRILDSIGFNWPVFCAVAIGFLASSYSLFATNFVTPALLYVYPPEGFTHVDVGELLDLTTLSATLFGMIVFGHFADRGGRKRLYGWELIILILATVGLVLSSQGFMQTNVDVEGVPKSSMSIYASIIFFRCMLGFGIGAEYPVSAVIAAEFASTDTRAVMMAAIFLMQSIGRLMAVGIGLGSLLTLMRRYDLDMDKPNVGAAEAKAKIVIDIVWRIVIGIGGIIALIAVGLRLIIPESPRYFSGIQKDLRKAALAVQQVGGKLEDDQRSETSVSSGVRHRFHKDQDPTPWFRAARKYLRAGGWKSLVGMSTIWLLLDVCFYGTSLDSPRTLNTLWLDKPASDARSSIWNADPRLPNATIQQTLDNNAVRTLMLSSISSLVGSIVAIPVVHYANRKRLLIGTSLSLTLLFIATGASVVRTYATPDHEVSMVFFALAQFMFNVGPNTLTFIMAAEIFPTVFRGTFYGISAAAGKLGAIIIRAIVAGAGDGNKELVAYLFVFSVIMLILAVLAILPGALPEVQRDTKKPANATASSRISLEAPDDESNHSASESWWDKTLPRRWKSLALEDIARYPLPQDELALRGDDTPEHEDEYPVPSGPVVGNGTRAPDFSSFPPEFTNAAVARADVEDGTRKFEDEVAQRFSSPVPREVSPSRK